MEPSVFASLFWTDSLDLVIGSITTKTALSTNLKIPQQTCAGACRLGVAALEHKAGQRWENPFIKRGRLHFSEDSGDSQADKMTDAKLYLQCYNNLIE